METFVGDSVKLMLDTNQDLSGYSNLFIKYIRPDGTTGNWASSECPTNNNVMERTLDSGELDMVGTWIVQAYITEPPAERFNGIFARFRVLDNIDFTTMPPTTAPPTTLVPTTGP